MKEFYTLHNGEKIPTIGLGTWLIDNSKVKEVVKLAIDLGYRHIDTAEGYGNEKGIGEALKEINLKREDIYITSKILAEIKSYQEAKAAIKKSIEDLQVSYIDLMLIHCPQPWALYGRGNDRFFEGNKEVWRALEEAYEEGLLKAIGVSNFDIDDISNILSSCKVKPMVNQICIHVGHVPSELIDYCKHQAIVVEAYSPLAHGRILNDFDLQKIADKYQITISQLALNFTKQLGLVTLPKATSKSHLSENLTGDVVISDEDMNSLLSICK